MTETAQMVVGLSAALVIVGQFIGAVVFFAKMSTEIRHLSVAMGKFYGHDGRSTFRHATECDEKRHEITELINKRFDSFQKGFDEFEKINRDSRTKMFAHIEDLQRQVAVLNSKQEDCAIRRHSRGKNGDG